MLSRLRPPHVGRPAVPPDQGMNSDRAQTGAPIQMPATPYCRPLNAGLCSTSAAVCRRIGRLLDALTNEVNRNVVAGPIAAEVYQFRHQLMEKLTADGWSLSYQGGERMKVRQPGHKRPF